MGTLKNYIKENWQIISLTIIVALGVVYFVNEAWIIIKSTGR